MTNYEQSYRQRLANRVNPLPFPHEPPVKSEAPLVAQPESATEFPIPHETQLLVAHYHVVDRLDALRNILHGDPISQRYTDPVASYAFQYNPRAGKIVREIWQPGSETRDYGFDMPGGPPSFSTELSEYMTVSDTCSIDISTHTAYRHSKRQTLAEITLGFYTHKYLRYSLMHGNIYADGQFTRANNSVEIILNTDKSNPDHETALDELFLNGCDTYYSITQNHSPGIIQTIYRFLTSQIP